MNLNNFENHIDPVILGRGQEYYDDGAVLSLEFEGDTWIAEVSGTDTYTVSLSLDDTGEIIESYCDCPYDFGPVCKHQVAVLYAMQDQPLKKIKQKSIEIKESLEKTLNGLDKKTLVSVLLDIAAEDKKIKADLLFRFAKKEDALNRARNLIKASIRDAMSDGFVEYADTHAATRGARKVLDTIDDMNIFDAVNIYFIVLEEMIHLQEFCDDSNGEVGGVIESAQINLTKLVKAAVLNAADGVKLMDMLLKHAADSIYAGWNEWRFAILCAAIPLCVIPAARKKLEAQLAALQVKEHGNNYSSRFARHEIQNILYTIISRFDGEEAAAAYMEQHLDNDRFRKTVIEQTLAKNHLERALKLCLDGENMDHEYAGLVMNWKKLRYAIYEKQKDIAGQKSLALEFIMDGDFDYYLKLKSLYKQGWAVTLEQLLLMMEKKQYSRSDIYVKILVHEHLAERILRYCQKNIAEITKLYKHLLPEHSSAVEQMFLQYIRPLAQQASDRKAYHEVCGIIESYAKACGKKGAEAVIQELREQHRRQPAFLDELTRVKT